MVTAGERWHGGSDILVDLCLVVNLGDHPRLGHCSTPGVPGGRVGKGGGRRRWRGMLQLYTLAKQLPVR